MNRKLTKQKFAKICSERILFLDGATGSNLMRRGMPGGVCPEEWITEHPEIMCGLQREYADAGTDILYAPTFTANRIKLSEYGLQEKVREWNRELVGISRKAAEYAASKGRTVYVAGDLTMTGVQLTPVGPMDFEELVNVYKEQIAALDEAGADLLVVETMMSLQECRAALIAAKETAPELPVMVTMTFESDGKSLFGTDAQTAAVVLESLGADAVGANCSTGPDKMAEIIRQMAEVTRIPIIAKANAGIPSLDENGQTVYRMRPEEFAEQAELVWQAGAGILGGCCGTTPQHIEALYRKFAGRKSSTAERRPEGRRYLTSERRTVSFDLGDPFLVIGERINPTGKKKLQAMLREGNTDLVLEFAESQEEAGASVLDINMGMSGINEKEMMLRVLEEVSGVTQLPLALDSSHVDVMEAALRRYPGRALINSISMEAEKLEKLLPLAKKYGAMFILLPLSEKGLPESAQEKWEMIETILRRAQEQGLTKEDIIVDGLVTTVGANPSAALETLETIRRCAEQGLATVVGLSNISFGLPERIYVNTAFLTMAVSAGLTMAIANPSQELLMAGAFASDLLLKKEGSDLRYIEYAGKLSEKKVSLKEKRTAFENETQRFEIEGDVGNQKAELCQVLYHAVLKGNRRNAAPLTRKALDAGADAGELLNSCLMPAIDEVGRLFDLGKYFLPQLIASAESMKQAILVLEPLLASRTDRKELPVIVMATVRGDIHDIGKNLVVMMLKNHGFRMIDLGKDVPAETIVQAAAEHHAALIGLSALMTTTMQEMRHVVDLVREQNLPVRVMIGGAVVTQEYADEIGADGYSSDAADAVRVAKRLLNLEE